MPEGYNNIALYENDAIREAVDYFNRAVAIERPSAKIQESKKQLTKVFYRECFAGVEYMFMPSHASEYLIRVFVLLPGYSGSNQEAHEIEIFKSERSRSTNIGTKVQGTNG